ncbi:MAG: carboxypeptidase regulatory-like domain-containing protein [Bryobacteraceae bacterium]|nr:carboxypeptidase regulatory-like domain-containing protein [Bryobacteraceae bacterium]
MANFFRRLPTLLLFAGAAMAQTSQIEGVVKDASGQPLKDALIKIERKDIRGSYKVKTKKKGDFLHAGLPLGTYDVSVEVEGKEIDRVGNVRTRLGDPTIVNFDLKAQAEKQQEIAKAAETGELTKEQARDMSPEQKAALEKAAKERTASMQKNKALNDAFNLGMEAMKTKQYPAALEQFTKAGELDPKQHVIWGNLAETHSELAKAQSGAEQAASLEKSVENYNKAIELMPSDAGYVNNLALVYARMKKYPEMEGQLKKAVTLDPTNAGRYYFNMGAVLTNAGQTDAACSAFKSATDTDANYADAYYQYGICLTGKATSKPDGSLIFPEGTSDAFQKYLALKPDGPYAESAKGMLQTMGSKIETQYSAPGAKKPVPGRKK